MPYQDQAQGDIRTDITQKRFNVSFPNNEKVVKPPKMSKKISKRVSGVNTPLASASWDIEPVTKQPIRLTAYVP